MKKIIFAILIFSFTDGYCFSYSIHPDAGKTAATFLKIPPGARGVAMGEAQTGINSNVFGMWWNPASVSMLSRKEIAFSYNRWFQNMNSGFLGLILPRYKGEVFGLMINSLSITDDMERRSGFEEDNPYFPLTETAGYFGAYDIMLGLLYSRKISDNLFLGATLKGILQSIDDEQAYGIALDIGVRSEVNLFKRNVSIGAAIKNFGPGIKFEEQSFNLPLSVSLGAGIYIRENLLFLLDLNQAIDDYLKIHKGAEYVLWDKLYIRAGYIYRLTGNPLGAVSGIRSGIGFKKGDFSIDYSFAPYSYLGASHRISFTSRFGRTRLKEKEVKLQEKVEPFKTEEVISEYNEAKLDWYPLIIATPDRMLWSITINSPTPMLHSIDIKTRQGPFDNVRVSVKEVEVVQEVLISTGTVNLMEFSFEHNLNKNVLQEMRVIFMVSRSRVTEYGLDADYISIAEYREGNWNEIRAEMLYQDELFYVYKASVSSLNKIIVFGEK